MPEILAAEAAAMAGVAPETFRGYARHRDPVTGEPRPLAPAPVRQVGRILLWDRDEVEAWIASRPGRGGVTPGQVRKQRAGRAAPPAELAAAVVQMRGLPDETGRHPVSEARIAAHFDLPISRVRKILSDAKNVS